MSTWKCLICKRPLPDFEPTFCCSQTDCDCQGQPVDPPTCSFECDEALFGHIGVPYDRRRELAGIKLYEVVRVEGGG